MIPVNERCQELVLGWGNDSCSRRATVTRDGKRYCTQHDPEAVKAKAAAQHARWQAEWAESAKRQNRRALEEQACAGIPDDVLASGLIGRLYAAHLKDSHETV